MALSRLQQICLLEESTEATEQAFSSLFAAAPAGYLPIDPSLNFEVETYERNVKSGSLTPKQALAGARLGSARFSLELTARATTIATAPNFDLPLRACGYRRVTCTRIPITGAISGGPFRHGEIITQAGGVTRTVIGDTYDGATEIFVANIDGQTPSTILTTYGLTWTGATSGATFVDVATITANAAYAWFPYSYALSKIKFDAAGLLDAVTAGDVLQGVTSGAIGVAFYGASVTANTDVYIRRQSGHFTTGETIKRLAPNADASIGVLAAASFETQVASPTISIGMAKDGVREALYGARGSFSLRGNIGEPAIIEFNFRGAEHSESPTDGANVASPTATDRVPPVLLGADLKIGKTGLAQSAEYSPCISSFSIDSGNQVEFRRCMSSATGIEEAQIIARRVTGQIDPELVVESLYDFVNQFTANGIQRVRLQFGTAPDRFNLRLHNLSATSITDGDRNGTATRQVSFGLHSGSQNATAGDNEMVLIWEPSDS